MRHFVLVAATVFMTAPVFAAVPGGCPTETVKIAMPEMLGLENGFRDTLAVADRARLDAALPRGADGGIAQCSGQSGADCGALAYTAAFNKTGLMQRFLATLCPKP